MAAGRAVANREGGRPQAIVGRPRLGRRGSARVRPRVGDYARTRRGCKNGSPARHAGELAISVEPRARTPGGQKGSARTRQVLEGWMLCFDLLEHCKISPSPDSRYQDSLPLTYFDTIFIPFGAVERVFFYELPCSVEEFLRDKLGPFKTSLSRALGEFRPLAGRLQLASNEVRCSDLDAVSFVLAENNDDFSDLCGNHPRKCDRFRPLVPRLTPESPLLALQLTLFPGATATFGFVFNARTRLAPPLPAAYFGNCLGITTGGCSAGELAGEDGWVEASKEVWSSVEGLKWKEPEKISVDCIGALLAREPVGLLTVAGSPWLGMYQVDFGWGRPRKVEIISIESTSAMSVAEYGEDGRGLEIGMALSEDLMTAFSANVAELLLVRVGECECEGLVTRIVVVVVPLQSIGSKFFDCVLSIVIQEKCMKRMKNAVPLEAQDEKRAVRATFSFSREQIEKLREDYRRKTGSSECSSFALVFGVVLACLVKVKRASGGATATFGFVFDARARLAPPLPAAYFGNCLGITVGLNSAGKLAGEDGTLVGAALERTSSMSLAEWGEDGSGMEVGIALSEGLMTAFKANIEGMFPR
ncbi:uncharacterized protein LOC144716420 [Wolffia australiana]